MIGYLPPIYPDELVYSWFCRYYIHSGSLTHKMALNDLFCKRSDSLNKEFIGNLNTGAFKRIEKSMSIEKLVIKHTMFPQYARFIPNKKEAIDKLINNGAVDVHKLFTVLPRENNDRFLKYCPICVKEDRTHYGEACWHRVHQIRGMRVCTKHGCMLCLSDVSAISYNSFSFYPMELNVNEKMKVVMAGEDALNYYSYIADVFNAPIDFGNEISVSATLNRLLKSQGYMKGIQRKVQQLTEDMNDFYSKLSVCNVATFNQVQRVLHGSLCEFSVVCQIAYFLGISVDELISPKHTST